MNPNDSDARPKARPNVTSAEFDGELVAYAPGATKGYHLNSTAAWLWQHCDGRRCVHDLVAQLGREFECGDADLRTDVENALRELREAGLIEIKGGAEAQA